MGPLAALTEQGKPWPINIMASMYGANLTIEGRINDLPNRRGIDLGFSLKGKDLSTLSKATGKAMPLKGSFDLSGRVSDPASKTYKISNLKVEVGGSDLSGTVEADLGSSQTEAHSRTLVSKNGPRALMPTTEPEGSRTAQRPARERMIRDEGQTKVFSADPLPLSALTGADAKVKLQAGQFILAQAAITNLDLGFNLRDAR